MKVSVVSKQNRSLIIELLGKRGFNVVENSPVVFVEKDSRLPPGDINIIFDPDNLGTLFDFLDAMNSMPRQKNTTDVIPGKYEDSYQVIHIDDIVYFHSDGNNTFCTAGARIFEIKKKLYELEQDLSGRGFIRVNKSCVVNILKLKEIDPWFGGRLLLLFNNCDDEIEVSRSYVGSFKKFIGL